MAQNEDLLVITAGDNVVRLLPPLTIGDQEIGEAFARLDRACTAIEDEMRQPLRGAAA